MTVGIILLSQDDKYLSSAGKLPSRPSFDKDLLIALCQGQTFVCGYNTINSLPNSILDTAVHVCDNDYDVNLGVVTLYTQPPHLLIVVRSSETLSCGKSFDLAEYNQYFSSKDLELWILA